jgi:rhamnose transport system permease protein
MSSLGNQSPYGVRAALNNRVVQIAAMIAVLGVILASIAPVFASGSNMRSIALDGSVLLVLAAGGAVVVVTRNLDLSVGSAVGVTAMVIGVVGRELPMLPTPVVALSGLVVGLLIGLINGIAVAYLRISSIIFTLGMLSVLRGVVYWTSGGQQVNANEVRPELVLLSTTGPFDVPWVVVIGIGATVAVWLFLNTARLGRSMYAVGSNPKAADLRGLPSRRAVISAFAISGVMSGVAGLIYIGRFSFVQNTTGVGLELTALAAVVIGGVSIFGGSGSVFGAAAGALLLTVIANGFAIVNLSVYWRNAVYGLLILVAVALEALGRNERFNRRRASRPTLPVAQEVAS